MYVTIRLRNQPKPLAWLVTFPYVVPNGTCTTQPPTRNGRHTMYRITYVGHDTITRELDNYDDAAELYLSMYAALTGDDTYQGFPSEAGFPSEGYSEVGHDDGMRWELAIVRAVWRELGKSHCDRCKGNGEIVPTSYTLPSGEAVCDTHYELYMSEPRTTRAASFFDQSRAARDDVAAGAYPSLSPTPTVLAPYFVSGSLLGKFPARIIGLISRETRAYLVKFTHNGEESLSFSHELELA